MSGVKTVERLGIHFLHVEYAVPDLLHYVGGHENAGSFKPHPKVTMRFRTVCLALGFVLSQTAQAQEVPAVIRTFYGNFSVPSPAPNADLIAATTTADWQSCTTPDKCRGRDVSSTVFAGFAKVIPNMKHEIREVIVTSDRIIVRGALSGTPSGEFFGLPHTGRSFTISTIDVHEMRGDRIARTWHLEDWAEAMAQLRGAK